MDAWTADPPPLAPAESVHALRRGEHLVLFAFRMMAVGHADCPVLHRTFGGVTGGEGEGALMHMLSFVRMVGGAGRRRVRLHPPGCCGMTEDERRVLAAIAAAQASFAPGVGEEPLRAVLAEILGAPADEGCVMAAQAVAAALTLGGLELPRRREGVTLH